MPSSTSGKTPGRLPNKHLRLMAGVRLVGSCYAARFKRTHQKAGDAPELVIGPREYFQPVGGR
jgi:hypothetical protein